MGFAFGFSSFSLPLFKLPLNHFCKEGREIKSNISIFCFYKNIILEDTLKILEVQGV